MVSNPRAPLPSIAAQPLVESLKWFPTWRGTSAGGGYTAATRSDGVCRRADDEQIIEGRDARRGHASAIHYGCLRLRIPARTAGRGADLRPGGGAPGMNAILR